MSGVSVEFQRWAYDINVNILLVQKLVVKRFDVKCCLLCIVRFVWNPALDVLFHAEVSSSSEVFVIYGFLHFQTSLLVKLFLK